MRQWWRHRQYRKSFLYKPQRRWFRKRYVVQRTTLTKRDLWRGWHPCQGHRFTKDPARALIFHSKEQAQRTADNTDLYKWASYSVVPLTE